MKKTIMFALMLLACMLLIPSAFAETVTYPTVENITNVDTLKDGEVSVSGSGTDTILITVENAKFKLLGDGGVSRPDDYAWVGLRFTMPDDASNVKIAGQTEEVDSSSHKFDKYFGFNLKSLEDAAAKKEDYVKTWDLTWGEGDTNKVTIKLVVKTASTTLEAKENEQESWNEEKYLEESKQNKLTYRVTCDVNAEICTSYEDVMYYDKDATKDAIEAQLRKLVGAKAKNLVIEGIYSDEKMTTVYDFEKDSAKTAYVKLTVKVNENEANPSTGDNLLTYVSLSVVALTGTLGTSLYLKKVNE